MPPPTTMTERFCILVLFGMKDGLSGRFRKEGSERAVKIRGEEGKETIGNDVIVEYRHLLRLLAATLSGKQCINSAFGLRFTAAFSLERCASVI